MIYICVASDSDRMNTTLSVLESALNVQLASCERRHCGSSLFGLFILLTVAKHLNAKSRIYTTVISGSTFCFTVFYRPWSIHGVSVVLKKSDQGYDGPCMSEHCCFWVFPTSPTTISSRNSSSVSNDNNLISCGLSARHLIYERLSYNIYCY